MGECGCECIWPEGDCEYARLRVSVTVPRPWVSVSVPGPRAGVSGVQGPECGASARFAGLGRGGVRGRFVPAQGVGTRVSGCGPWPQGLADLASAARRAGALWGAALRELEFPLLLPGCGSGVGGGSVPCRGQRVRQAVHLGGQDVFYFKTCNELRGRGSCGCVTCCSHQQLLWALRNLQQQKCSVLPPPPFGVVGFSQTSSDLCRNLQLQGFVFLLWCRQ